MEHVSVALLLVRALGHAVIAVHFTSPVVEPVKKIG